MSEQKNAAIAAGRGEHTNETYIPLQWTAAGEPDQDHHVREFRLAEEFLWIASQPVNVGQSLHADHYWAAPYWVNTERISE